MGVTNIEAADMCVMNVYIRWMGRRINILSSHYVKCKVSLTVLRVKSHSLSTRMCVGMVSWFMVTVGVQNFHIVVVVWWLVACDLSKGSLSGFFSPRVVWDWWRKHRRCPLHREWLAKVLSLSPILWFLAFVSGLREFCMIIWSALVSIYALLSNFLIECYQCLGWCLCLMFVDYRLGLLLTVFLP